MEPHRHRVRVRADDIDSNGHVRGPVYVAYADDARWELVRAAGVSTDALAARGWGPVNLETTVRFRHELLLGDALEVRTVFEYEPGRRTSTVQQSLVRLPDELVAAEVESVAGMLDLRSRRLLADPAALWREVTTDPAALGLD